MNISAIILAAGKSRRMGENKLLMPWGRTTVLEKVIQTIQNAGIEDIILVTSSSTAKVITDKDIQININSANDEMLSSIQLGLQVLTPSARQAGTSPKSERKSLNNKNHNIGFEGGREGALIVLGDQPQIEEQSARSVCEAFQKSRSNLIVPSYEMRRGHPWLIARPLWSELLNLQSPESPRDFLNKHKDEIEYVIMDTPSILQDIDTPEDYLKFKP